MMVVAVALLPIMFTDMKITRKEGAFFTIVYIAYTIMLVHTATAGKQVPEQAKAKTVVEQTTTPSTPIALPEK